MIMLKTNFYVLTLPMPLLVSKEPLQGESSLWYFLTLKLSFHMPRGDVQITICILVQLSVYL